MARKREVLWPPATSLPRPTRSPSSKNRRTGAMPEAMFVLEAGQWATHTPRSRIMAISSSPERTQWAIMVGTPPPNRPKEA